MGASYGFEIHILSNTHGQGHGQCRISYIGKSALLAAKGAVALERILSQRTGIQHGGDRLWEIKQCQSTSFIRVAHSSQKIGWNGQKHVFWTISLQTHRFGVTGVDDISDCLIPNSWVFEQAALKLSEPTEKEGRHFGSCEAPPNTIVALPPTAAAPAFHSSAAM
jgi:hypothetical protein